MQKTVKLLTAALLVLVGLLAAPPVHADTYEVPKPTGTFDNRYANHAPYNVYYQNILGVKSQTMYHAEQLTALQGKALTGLTFSQKTAYTTEVDITVRLFTTTSNLTGLLSSSGAKVVFSGRMKLSSKFVIPFSQSFLYTGGNLVVEIIGNATGTDDNVSFYGYNAVNGDPGFNPKRSISSHNITTPQAFQPKTTITYESAKPDYAAELDYKDTNVLFSNQDEWTDTWYPTFNNTSAPESKTFTIKNTGKNPITFRPTLDGDAGWFTLSPDYTVTPPSLTVAPDATGTVTVTYTPATNGLQRAVLKFNPLETLDKPLSDITFFAFANITYPYKAEVSTTAIDFNTDGAPITTNTALPATVTVTNQGTNPFTVTPTLAADARDLTVSGAVTVPAGESRDVTVTLTPTVEGEQNTSLTLAYTDAEGAAIDALPNATVALHSNVVFPKSYDAYVTYGDDNKFDFSAKFGTETGKYQDDPATLGPLTATFTNNGGNDLTFNPVLTAETPAAFTMVTKVNGVAVDAAQNYTLGVGQSATVEITFNAKAAPGAHTATVSLNFAELASDHAANAPIAVTAESYVRPAYAVSFDRNNVEFENTESNRHNYPAYTYYWNETGSVGIYLTNDGTEPITINPAIVGADGSAHPDFTVSCDKATLNTFEWTFISVSYKARHNGTQQATLQLNANVPEGTELPTLPVTAVANFPDPLYDYSHNLPTAEVALNPNPYNHYFDEGYTETRTYTLVNKGNQPLGVTADFTFNIDGNQSSTDFTVVPANVQIPVDGQQEFTVTYTAKTDGWQKARLCFTVDGVDFGNKYKYVNLKARALVKAKEFAADNSITGTYDEATMTATITGVPENATADYLTVPATITRTNSNYSSETFKVAIGEGAFANSKFELVTLADGIETIGARAFENAELVHLQLPASVKTIGDEAFKGSQLGSLLLHSGVTTIGAGAFNETAIGHFGVLKANANFKAERGVLSDKAGTTLIALPRDRNGAYAVPEGFTTIKSGAFNSCAITELTFSADVTEIEANAFNGSAIRNLTSAPSIEVLATDMFNGVDRIEEFTISPAVTAIEANVFSSCANLTRVFATAAVPPSLDPAAFPGISGAADPAAVKGRRVAGNKPELVLTLTNNHEENLRIYDAYVAAGYKNLFSIKAPEIVTSVDEYLDGGVKIAIYAQPGLIKVDSIDPVRVAVYTLDGVLLDQSEATKNYEFAVPSGLYIVTAGNISYKLPVQ